MKKIFTASLIGMISLGLLIGCGSDKDNAGKDEKDNSTETVDIEDKNDEKEEDANSAASEKRLEDIKLSAQDAYQKYSEKYPDSGLIKLSLDTDNDKYVYKIEGITEDSEIEVKIDSENGEFIEDKKEERDLSDSKQTFNLMDIPNLDSLIDLALKDAGEGFYLDEWELSIDDNTLVLVITVKNDEGEDIEYQIDAMSGAIIDKDS